MNNVDLNTILVPVAGIEPESIVDGPGYRFVIFTQGCPHFCKGCHNPQTHSMKCSHYMSAQTIINEIKKDMNLLDGITLSGGEPFLHVNKLFPIAKWAHNEGLSVMVYTGYKYEELVDKPENLMLLKYVDILADGKFEIDKRSLNLLYVGSSNQRLIDVQKTLKTKYIVLWKPKKTY